MAAVVQPGLTAEGGLDGLDNEVEGPEQRHAGKR